LHLNYGVIEIKTNLATEKLKINGGGEVFGRNLGRLSAYHNGGVRLFLNVRCVVPRGGIGLLTVNGGYQTILFFILYFDISNFAIFVRFHRR
jgi:hypothetical protein